MNNYPENFVATACKMADAARDVVLKYFRKPILIDDKADESPVTIADKETELALRAIVEHELPNHGFIGEEFGSSNENSEFVWVVDPIDGTKSFITGKPCFGTLIALLYKNKPILGIIDQPFTKERWLGIKNQPTTLNGEPIRTRTCSDLKKAVLYSTGYEMFKGAEKKAFDALTGKTKLTRYSADCYAYGLLALGFVDIVCESSMKLYDYAALVPIVEGAGGMICDWNGAPLTKDNPSGRVLSVGDKNLLLQITNLFSDIT